MRVRTGFVSNSSSSSFVCIATSVNPMGIDASDTEGLFGIGKMLCEGRDRLWLDSEMVALLQHCLLYTSPSPRDRQKSRMPSSA